MQPVAVSIDYAALFNTVLAEGIRSLEAVMPIAVVILGAMTAVSLGVKIWKKLTGAR